MIAKRFGCRIAYEGITARLAQLVSLARTAFLRRSASPDQSIDQEEQHCSDNGSNESSGLTGFVPTDDTTEKAGYECAGDTEQDGDETSARVATGHKKLRDRANY